MINVIWMENMNQLRENVTKLPYWEIEKQRKKLERFAIYLYLKIITHIKLFKNDHFQEWVVYPMSYWRMVEVPTTLYLLRPCSNEKILDIGSPKFISLFLALNHKVKIFVTDLHDYFINDFEEFRKILQLQNMTIETCDATKILYQNETFNKVFSISTIEHIPQKGDITALKEIYRVLKPGGQCILTVPYNRNSITEYTKKKLYWIKEEGRSFYQRRYSCNGLLNRLILPAGFSVMKAYLVAEMPVKQPYIREDGTFIHNYHFINNFMITKVLLKSKIPYLAYVLQRWYFKRLCYSTTDWNDPNIRYAILHLQKNTSR